MKLIERSWLLILLFASELLVGTVSGYKILGLFFFPGRSHFDFFRPLMVGLAEKGHEVTVVSYFPNRQPVANYSDLTLTGMPIITNSIDLKLFEGSPSLIPFKLPMFFQLHSWGLSSCEAALNSDAVKKILNDKTSYDVILLEQFNSDCAMAVAYLLQAPVIAIGSCFIMPWHYHRMGSPFIPSFMPMNFLPHWESMGFVERANNFIHFHSLNFMYNFFTQSETNSMIRKHLGAGIPPVEELVKNTTLMFVNQHYSLAGAKPLSPNIIELGGMQIMKAAPLEWGMKNLLDSSVDGVIYISWGSMIRPDSLPIEKRDAILRTARHFPRYTFLMKWSNETIPNQPSNLHTRTWMPQRDILCHPKVKAFMTHGGLLGISEAVYCGVPMLLTPLYGDQFVNSAAVINRKAGVVVNYQDLREDKIIKALDILLSPMSKCAAKYISDAYKNRPETPLDLGIWWVEHVVHTKGVPLTATIASKLNWFHYHSLDVYAFLLFCISVVIFVVKVLFKLICFVCNLRKKTSSPKNKRKQL